MWNDPSIEEIRAEDLAGGYPVIQYIAPDGFRIDILSRLGEVFSFDDLESGVYSYGDVEVTVASPETLYAMKHNAIRLQDRADAQKLKEKFNLKD